MLRGHNLHPRPRPYRRQHDPLRSRLALLRIISRRNPLMAGGNDCVTGDGEAFGGTCYQGPWMWKRPIRRGQWAGPWRRVRWDEEAT